MEKILDILEFPLEKAFIKKKNTKNFPYAAIAPLVDRLSQEFPDFTFILFGSRAKGTAWKYSDFDIGVYSANKIDPKRLSQLMNTKEALEENLPWFIDFVDLTRADKNFLQSISKNWIFLTGPLSGWVSLQQQYGP